MKSSFLIKSQQNTDSIQYKIRCKEQELERLNTQAEMLSKESHVIGHADYLSHLTAFLFDLLQKM